MPRRRKPTKLQKYIQRKRQDVLPTFRRNISILREQAPIFIKKIHKKAKRG